MSGENELHAETESEDGGISLSPFELSELGDESAPTSASQSPHPSATGPAHITSTIWPSGGAGVVSSLSPLTQSMEGTMQTDDFTPLPSLMELEITATHSPPMSPMSHNEASFAQALSGELLNMPTASSFPGEEGHLGPLYEPAGMPQAISHSTPVSPPLLAAHEGNSVVEVNNEDQLQHMQQHNVTHLQDLLDIHGLNSGFSLPSLTDVFGSDFLTQTTGPPHAQASTDTAIPYMQEEYADFWDEMEDSIRNLHCDSFFNHWKTMYAHEAPHYPRISELASKPEKIRKRDKIVAGDLDPRKPDPPDLQGIHWSRFQTTKEAAREVRRMTYSNHTNHTNKSSGDEDQPYSPRLISNLGQFGSQSYKMKFSETTLPNIDLHYEFRETNMRFRSYISHFQLRHSLFASSKNALIYNRQPAQGRGYGAYMDSSTNVDAKIMTFNPETSSDECVMDFSSLIDRDSPKLFRPSTLNAGNGVLVVGSFEGAYAMKSLAASFEAKPIMGVITEPGFTSSTNHIQNFLDRRSGLPQVAFSSNDKTIRILDCTSNKFVAVHRFPYEVNCSVTSPDGRMRLLVGDDCDPIVANAETGEQITKLEGHDNFGFACDWASDGISMATGHQDGFVRVWDARKFSQSVQSIAMEMAGSRTLQFSPLGSGPRVLVIAEPGDFVHVVNAQTYKSEQVIEFFGEIAGISMPPDGSSLYIANQDPRYGGLMEFERRRRFGIQEVEHPESRWGRGMEDWLPDSDLEDDARVLLPRVRRHGRDFGWNSMTM